MSEPITQADANEIIAFCATHPNVRIHKEDDGGWYIVVATDKYLCELHPRTFLDIIRGAEPGESILKTT